MAGIQLSDTRLRVPRFPTFQTPPIGWFLLAALLFPAAAPACEDVQPPTSALAWRARVIERTPVRGAGVLDPDLTPAVLVLGSRTDERRRCWLRGGLPTRPTASSGEINAARVRLGTTPWRIVVRRRARTVTL